MTLFRQRFAVGDPTGARATQWVVMWSSKTSDVYIAARLIGATIKVSLHQSGQCHVRGPDVAQWRGVGPPPRFLGTWRLNPESAFEHPFGIIVPDGELSAGPWARQKEKGTQWIAPTPDRATEIAVFLTRVEPPPVDAARGAGWTTTIVLERLPDGRDLWVVAGTATLPPERHADLVGLKARAPALIASLPAPPAHPRLLLFADGGQNPRHFVEASVGRR